MAFHCVGTRILSPRIPGIYLPSNLWCGTGVDRGLLAYNSLGTYIITQNHWTYQLKIGNAVYTPVYNDVNGFIYWKYGSRYIYYSRGFGWIEHDNFPGYEPQERYNSETREFEGDSFHSGSIPQVKDGASSSWKPRGRYQNSGGVSKTVSFYFPRWESATRTLCGEYAPIGESGKLYLGLPCWRDKYGRVYVRSLEKVNGRYTYGAIRYFNGKWLIGELNSPSGWWKGEEPSKTSPVTFRFCKLKDAAITGSDLELTLRDYVLGDNSGESYLGEVAIWR